jgi:hypothetical protein
MKRLRVGLVSLTIIGIGVLVTPGTAAAGGWAVSTVDPVGAPAAGERTTVGFTIRQHGVRPVNPEGEVGIGIESAAGVKEFFAATPSGERGHYVAPVKFPAPGSYRWTVRQGWFGPQDLGRIEIAEAGAAVLVGTTVDDGGSAASFRGPLSVRVLLPVLGLGLGAFAIVETVRTRRRRSRGLVTP